MRRGAWALLSFMATGCVAYGPLIRESHQSLAEARVELARVRSRVDALERKRILSTPMREALGGPPSRARQPERRPVLLILDLEDRANVLDATDRQQLSAFLALITAEQERFWLIPRASMQVALRDEKARGAGACYAEDCVLSLGKALATSFVVHPLLSPEVNGCILGATLYDLRSETTTWAKMIHGACALPSLRSSAQSLAWSLAEAPLEPTP